METYNSKQRELKEALEDRKIVEVEFGWSVILKLDDGSTITFDAKEDFDLLYLSWDIKKAV